MIRSLRDANDFDQFQHGHRIEEMQTYNSLLHIDRISDFTDKKRRGIGCDYHLIVDGLINKITMLDVLYFK